MVLPSSSVLLSVYTMYDLPVSSAGKCEKGLAFYQHALGCDGVEMDVLLELGLVGFLLVHDCGLSALFAEPDFGLTLNDSRFVAVARFQVFGHSSYVCVTSLENVFYGW